MNIRRRGAEIPRATPEPGAGSVVGAVVGTVVGTVVGCLGATFGVVDVDVVAAPCELGDGEELQAASARAATPTREGTASLFAAR
jgi:hypothetical protein